MPEENKDSEQKVELDIRKVFDIERIAKEIVSIRKRPLLLMFYSAKAGRIRLDDITYLEKVLDGFNETELDVLIHTRGGGCCTVLFFSPNNKKQMPKPQYFSPNIFLQRWNSN